MLYSTVLTLPSFSMPSVFLTSFVLASYNLLAPVWFYLITVPAFTLRCSLSFLVTLSFFPLFVFHLFTPSTHDYLAKHPRLYPVTSFQSLLGVPPEPFLPLLRPLVHRPLPIHLRNSNPRPHSIPPLFCLPLTESFCFLFPATFRSCDSGIRANR
jgi:hypothetical protein